MCDKIKRCLPVFCAGHLCKCRQENGLDPCIDMSSQQCNVFPRTESDERFRDNTSTQAGIDPAVWKPLLLIIPLRLGLTDINPVYFDSLKVQPLYVLLSCSGSFIFISQLSNSSFFSSPFKLFSVSLSAFHAFSLTLTHTLFLCSRF